MRGRRVRLRNVGPRRASRVPRLSGRRNIETSRGGTLSKLQGREGEWRRICQAMAVKSICRGLVPKLSGGVDTLGAEDGAVGWLDETEEHQQ